VILHNIEPKEQSFDWQNPQGERRPTPMIGIWLGSAGRNLRHVFVPVMVSNEREPKENWWGIRESRTNRPKIVADSDASPGVIAIVSSFRGPGRTIGKVLVDVAHLNHIFVVAHGIGGQERPALSYSDYLLQISLPTRLLIIGTDNNFYVWAWDGKEVSTPKFDPAIQVETDFVPLDDPRVGKWTRVPEENAV